MMDREGKMFAIVIGIISIVFIIALVIAVRQDIEREEYCNSKNGIVVKTSYGWKCIEGKYL